MNRNFVLCIIVFLIGCNSAQDNSTDALANPDRDVGRRNSTFGPRWPQEEEGQWLNPDDPRLANLKLTHYELIPIQPLPADGYVPVECTGPTVRAELVNHSDFEIANIRIRIRAFAKTDGNVLGDETTDTPGRYISTLAGESTLRKFVLDLDGEFSKLLERPEYEIEVSVVAIRISDARQ